MKVASFIANRIAFNRQKSFSRFIIRLSIAATVISVAVMIVTWSFANGFQEKISQKIFSFLGHIQVQDKQPDKAVFAEEYPIMHNDTVVNDIKKNPAVVSVHAFATRYAILKTKDEMEGVKFKGVDSSFDFNQLKTFIKEGRQVNFNDSTYSREIMISTYTAEQLKLKLNDKVLIYFIKPGSSPEDEDKFRADKLTITGIYKTGIEDYDKYFAIGDIKLIRRLNGWDENEIGGYEVFLNDYTKIDKVAKEIHELDSFPVTWTPKSARNISPNIFDWLNMQSKTRNVLMGIMAVVALINLITCLIILVLERIRMIGVLKALGAKNITIQTIFIHHTLIITITGIILGTLLALGLLYLQQETGFIKLQEEAYYLSEAAVKIVWWQILLIISCTFAVCLVILTIPSLLVRRIQPVKAIQFR
ncbi:MAG: ABC transporter permease [Bacteroidetes bacterium]|nr:MAG: ABC transporter permease [Bacteroidota bacterium]